MTVTRRALPACVLALAPPWAAAQAARSYSVLSELARDVHVIIQQPKIGSNLDQNRQQRMPIPERVFDRAALAQAKAELQTAQPGAAVRTFVPLEADVFDPRQSFAPGSDAGLPADLKDALRQQGSSHLLLLTRYPAEAAIQTLNAKVGSGRLEGIGFYVDHQTLIDVRGANVVGRRGFLAPFVYLRATLIDGTSGRVVATRTHTRAEAYPAGEGADSPNPWDTLDAAQKVRLLSDMLQQALADVVPAVLAAR
jgi:hypothetical protein